MFESFEEELEVLRKENFDLCDPSPIENSLKEYYEYIKTKRRNRPKGVSSVAMSEKIISMLKGEKKYSICFFLVSALREINKKKVSIEQHRKKCFDVDKLISEAESLLSSATSNEQILFDKIKRLVRILIIVQCPPGEY